MDNDKYRDRLYPAYPRIGVGVFVVHGEKILLVKRGQEPAKGEWSVPGGLVEVGESLETAARRELAEECGIQVNIEQQLEVYEYIDKDRNNKVRYHFIVIDLLANYQDGTVEAASDIDAAQWFYKDQVKTLNCNDSIKRIAESVLIAQ